MSAARDRLKNQYYNSLEAGAANPGGMGRNGHRTNFPQALKDVGDVAQEVVDHNDDTLAAVVADNDATQAAVIADNDATEAAIIANNAATALAVDASAQTATDKAAEALDYRNTANDAATTATNAAGVATAAASDAKRTVANNFPDRLDATGSWFTEAAIGDPGMVADPTEAAISNVAGYGFVFTKANAQGQIFTKGLAAAADGKFYEVEAEVEWTVKDAAETPSFTVGLQGLDAAFASTGAQVQAALQPVAAAGVQTMKHRFGYAAPSGGAAWPQPGSSVWLRPYVLFNRKSDNSGPVSASTARVRRLTVRDVTAVVLSEIQAAAAAASAASVSLASQAEAEAGAGAGLMSATRVGQAIKALVGLGQSVKTAAYAVVATDRGSIIEAGSGNWALTFPSAAAVGANFYFYSKNAGTGAISFVRTGADTLDGLTGYTSYSGELRVWRSDGVSAWRSTVLEPFYKVFTASDAAFKWPPGYQAFEGVGWGSGGKGGDGDNSSMTGQGGGGAPMRRYSIAASEVVFGATATITVAAPSAAASSIAALRTFPGGVNGAASTSNPSLRAWDGLTTSVPRGETIYDGGQGGAGKNTSAPSASGGGSKYGGGGGGGGAYVAWPVGAGGMSLFGGAGGNGANSGTAPTAGSAPGGGGGGGHYLTTNVTGAAGGRGEIRMRGVV